MCVCPCGRDNNEVGQYRGLQDRFGYPGGRFVKTLRVGLTWSGRGRADGDFMNPADYDVQPEVPSHA
jgi:hypothetical protein